MRALTFTVPKEWEQSKLKVFLRGYCNLSARLLTKQKRVKMGLTINGEHGRANDLLKTGDVVCVNLPDIEKDIEAVPLPLSIVYEDDDIIVINKDWSMPIYPTAGHDRDSLANALFYHYQIHGVKLGFHPVYRLDKDTSGLIVIAKHGYAAAVLSKSIEKEYTAVCEGVLKGEGTIDVPIRLKEGYTIQREVAKDGQRAVTHWKVVGGTNHHTLLQIRLETGRTHQIRVHFSHIGHPLAGDDMYGGHLNGIGRQVLCCSKVLFVHPVTGHRIELACPPQDDMMALVQ